MYDDHVIVSIDWSQIELVLIGEFSGDPAFAECYGQLPYKDLHRGAAAGVLDVPLEEFVSLSHGNTNVSPHLLVNPKGETMEPHKAFKYWRTEIGKGSNFEYFYSGAMHTVAEKMGWTQEQACAAVDRYRERFEVAEAWRVATIHEAQAQGHVTLPDHHRRTKFEATPTWARMFRSKWQRYGAPEISWFGDLAIRRIQSRANNQVVNALIQGSCATLAKRSIPRIQRAIEAKGWGTREARYMFLIHDELLYSVHRDLVTEFIQMAQPIMNNHPEIISKLVMDCSPSVGLTLEPWQAEKARTGQVELREVQELPCIDPVLHGQPVPPEQWGTIVDWLFHEARR